MKPSPRRLALVTGGSGYFGSLLVNELRSHGYRVRVLDWVDVEDRHSDVELIRGDVRDKATVRRACRGVDIVHHNVAQVPLAKDKELFEAVNVGGTRTLLEASAKEGVGKVVHVSSSAVFGIPESNPVTEKHKPRPREAYGRAKLKAEGIVNEFVSRGLDVTMVRPRTILGHGRLGIFQVLFELVRRGKPIYVLGGGNNRYQFVHADDLADACIRAGEKAGPELFHVGTEQFGTMRSMLEALVKHAATNSPIRSLPMRMTELGMNLTSYLRLSPLGPYHALMYGREMFFDVTHARNKLGWRSHLSNEQMICESYDNYVANRSDVLRRSHASHHRSALRAGILRVMFHLP